MIRAYLLEAHQHVVGDDHGLEAHLLRAGILSARMIGCVEMRLIGCVEGW